MLSPEEIIAEATGQKPSAPGSETNKLSPEDIIAHVTSSTQPGVSKQVHGSSSEPPYIPPGVLPPGVFPFSTDEPPAPPLNALERYRASRPDWKGSSVRDLTSGSTKTSGKVLHEILGALSLGADVTRGTLKGHPIQGETAQEFFHAQDPMAESPADPSAHLAGAIRHGAGMLVDPLVLAGPVISLLIRFATSLKASGGLPPHIVPGSSDAQRLLLEGPPGSVKTGEMVWRPKIETENIPIPGRVEDHPDMGFEESRPTIGEFYRSRATTETEQKIEDALAAKQQLEVRDAEPGGYRLFEDEQAASMHPGSPNVIGGVPSTYPDWYKKLTTKADGSTPLTRKQVEKALDHMVNDRAPKHSEGRAYRLVKEAIKDQRLSDIYRSNDRATIQEPIYGEQQFRPVETGETVTTRIPGGIMKKEVDRGSWEWVEHPTSPPPHSARAVFDAPEEAITSAPTSAARKTRFQRWWDVATSKLSPDLPMLRNIPASPAISAVENLKVKPELALSELERQPWFQELLKSYNTKQGGEVLKDLEAQVVDEFERKGMGAVNDWFATKQLPEPVQAMLNWRVDRLAEEQAMREEAGLQPHPVREGPYFPHKVESDLPRGEHFFTDIESLLNESPVTGSSPMQTTLGGFEKTRSFSTMREGEQEQLVYQHPLRAFILREVEGSQMRATLEMIKALKNDGVLWPTEAEALAASPTGEVSRLGKLWVRSKEEANFLAANLKEVQRGSLSSWFNTYIRNPSLVVPYPHIIKNMGMKYLLSRMGSGQYKGFFSDVNLYRLHPEQVPVEEKALFDKLLPFSDTGQQIAERLQNLVPSEKIGERVGSAVGKLNQWSSNKIFKEYDPAMRYALWKSYLRGGMEPQEAANHVWKDLVRYNLRSSWKDYLSTIPGNFFVPWRIGTWETMLKHLYSHPGKTAAFVGLFDYLREVDYRKTGNFQHMFFDYLERPIATTLTDPGSALKTTALTFAIGPDGENTVKNLQRLLAVAEGTDQWSNVKQIFWGIAQMQGMGKEFSLFETDHNPAHLVNIGMRFFTSRHPVFVAPPRFLEGLPEWLPGMEKSSEVRQRESLYGLWKEKADIKAQQKSLRREQRP